MIEILILLPIGDLDLQYFNLTATDGDRGIPVYLSKVCVNLTDVILQDLHDLVFLLFNHEDVQPIVHFALSLRIHLHALSIEQGDVFPVIRKNSFLLPDLHILKCDIPRLIHINAGNHRPDLSISLAGTLIVSLDLPL